MDQHDSMHRGISRGVLRHGWLSQLSEMARRFVSGSARQFSRLRQFAPQCCHSSRGITRQIIEAQVELDKWEASQVLPHGYIKEKRSHSSKEGLINDDSSSAHSSTTVLSLAITQAINSLENHHTICSAGPSVTTSRRPKSSSSTSSGDLRSSDAWSSSSGMMDDFAAMRANGSKCSPTATGYHQVPQWEEGGMVEAWAPAEDEESSTLLRLAISEEVIAGPSCQQTDVTGMDNSANWAWAPEEDEESSTLLRLAISEEEIAGPSCQQTDVTGMENSAHLAWAPEEGEESSTLLRLAISEEEIAWPSYQQTDITEMVKSVNWAWAPEEDEASSALLKQTISEEEIAGPSCQEPASPTPSDDNGTTLLRLTCSEEGLTVEDCWAASKLWDGNHQDLNKSGEEDINCSDKAEACLRDIREDDVNITAGTGTDKTDQTDGDGLYASQTDNKAQMKQEHLSPNDTEDEEQEQDVANSKAEDHAIVEKDLDVDLKMIPRNITEMVKAYIQAENAPVFEDDTDTDEVAWNVQCFLGMMRTYYGSQVLDEERTSAPEDLLVIADTAQVMSCPQNSIPPDIQRGYNSLSDYDLLEDTANGVDEVFDLPSKEVMDEMCDGLYDDSFGEEETFDFQRSASMAVIDDVADALPKKDGAVEQVDFECHKSSSKTLMDDLADTLFENDLDESNTKMSMLMDDAMKDLIGPAGGPSMCAGITPEISESLERVPEEIPLPGRYRLIHSVSHPGFFISLNHDPPNRAEAALLLRGGTRSLQKLAPPPSGFKWENELMQGSGLVTISSSPMSMSSSGSNISLPINVDELRLTCSSSTWCKDHGLANLTSAVQCPARRESGSSRLSEGRQFSVTAARDTTRGPTSQPNEHRHYGQEPKEPKDSTEPRESSPMSHR